MDGTLKVGFTGDYAPFSLYDAKGNLTGADVTMAHDLAKTLGVKLAIVPSTWKAMETDLEQGRFDIAMGGVSVTPDRERIGDFSIPILHDGKRPIVRCVDRNRLTSIASINQPEVRVVFNLGGTNERFARKHFPRAQLKEDRDNRTMFDELAARRADVIVTDGSEVNYQAQRHPGVLCPAAVRQSFDHSDKAYWMTPDPALKKVVDSWLGARLRTGFYELTLKTAATGYR
jgi:cyclohexadienyl dehydratase